jgi:hypothetical protein
MPKNEVKQQNKPAFWYTVVEGKLHRNPVEGETPDGKNEKGYPYVVARGVSGKITGVGIDEKTHSTGSFHVISLKVETEDEVSFVQCNFSGGGYAKSLMQRLTTIKSQTAFDKEFYIAPYAMDFIPEGTTENRVAKGFSMKSGEWKVEHAEIVLPAGKEVTVKKEKVWDDTEAREVLMGMYEDMKKYLLDINHKPAQPMEVPEDLFAPEHHMGE